MVATATEWTRRNVPINLRTGYRVKSGRSWVLATSLFEDPAAELRGHLSATLHEHHLRPARLAWLEGGAKGEQSGKRCAGSFAVACVDVSVTGLTAVVLALGMR